MFVFEKIKKNLGKFIIILLSILCIILFFDSCQNRKLNKILNHNLTEIGFKNQNFKTEVTKLGDSLNIQSQIILSQKQAIENNLIEIKRLKNIKSKVSVITQTKIDTLFIPYKKTTNDTIYANANTKNTNYFDYTEKWFSINGFATDEGININSLSVKNDFSIYIADRKMGLFKKSKPSVMLINKNPYTETIKMNNVVIEYHQPFYKKNWFWGSVGFLGGVLIAK